MVDITKEPYNNRFKPDSQYEQILFNPDRPLQASELTELQSILAHQSAKLGNVLMIDGDIQEGMSFRISEDESEITIEDGEVYLDGKVRSFHEQTIPYDNEGVFEVCVALSQEIITSEEDEELLDQTSGVESFYSPGADRLKETVFLTSDTELGVPILEFRDGDLFLGTPGNREMTKLNEILAERTYDESGSYKVKGFSIRSEPNPMNDNELIVVVDSGRAYVRGFQIDKPTSTRIIVDKAQDMKTVQSEAFYYDNRTRRGRLGHSPVARVNRVTGQVQVTKESVNRGVTGDSPDTLANGSITSVVKVWTEIDGEEDAVFRQGVDFQLRNGNQIDWSPQGSEPRAGTTYYVTYVYNKALVKDTDFKVDEGKSVEDPSTYIDFNGMMGNKPLPDSMVLVDYDYYLAREDLIVMNKEGEIRVLPGQPDSLESVKKPNSEDPYSLVLGSITIFPDSTTTIPHMSSVTRLSMVDLQNMKNRIDNLEYNMAVNALDSPAMEDVNPAILRGVFTDGFINMSKYDNTHPDAKIAFSFEDAQITLPYKSADKKKPNFLAGSSNAHTWGRLVTSPFTEEVSISQPHVTDVMNINPYHVFNAQGVLKLDPSEDNWIDETRVTVVEEDAETLDVKRWWSPGHMNDPWVEDQMRVVSDIQLDDGYTWSDDTRSERAEGQWRWDASMTGTRLQDGGQRTNISKVEFMRPIDVSFYAQNMRPNENNFKLYFDGKLVPVTPASGFQKGSETGTIRSNSSGEIKGTFTIPSGVRTGVREVIIENADNVALTTFVAEGTLKEVEDVIRRTRVTINLIDPLAQSFQFREDRVVTSFDVFFASKDSDKNVTVQVRGITPGGMPDKTIYAETVLTPSQINISDDGSVATNITFDDPLMVDSGKEYALVLITDSDLYTVWIATRGQEDLRTGARITANPYLQGVLYSSSNASAWTIHQDSDLTFNVKTAKFNETAVLEFDTMTDITADAIVLMATTLTPENTGSIWEVKMVMENEAENVTINDKQWIPLANYEEIELNQIAREVKLRSTFRANRYMSPIMSLNDLLLTSFLSELSGSYIGRTIDASDGAEYNKIRLSYESFEPGQSNVKPRYSVDGGTTWRDFTESPKVESRTGEFNRIVYEEKVTEDINGYDSIKVRLDFSTTNSFVRPRVQRLMVNFNYE